MSAFRFQAVGQDGRMIRGEIEAASQDAAVERLRGQGALPVTVKPGGRLWSLFGGRARGMSAANEESLFSGLADLLAGGLTLDQSLDLLSATGDGALGRRTAKDLLRRIRSGESLSGAMKSGDVPFEPVTLALIRAGEEGGDLTTALKRLAELAERRRATADKLRAALTYPAIVLLAAAFAIGFILIVVVPGFIPLFEQNGTAMPASMARLIWLRELLVAHGWALLTLGLILILGARAAAAMPDVQKRVHAVFLRLPWLGPLLAASDIARFARTLAGMLSSGIPLASALPLAADTLKNRSLRHAVAKAGEEIRTGKSLSDSLKTIQGLPAAVGHLLRISEAAGQPALMLNRIATLSEREVEGKTDRLMAMLPAVLIVGLGGLVAMIVSMLLGAVLDANQLAL